MTSNSAIQGSSLEPLGIIAGLGMSVPGTSVPGKIIGNDFFASYLETSDQWISERTGIKERRWIEDGQTLVDLAEPACSDAIRAAGLDVSDVDGIIVATSTPDNTFPSSACQLQTRLGLSKCFAFDLAAACSGFLYGMLTAQAMLRNGQAQNILLVGAEIFSRVIDKQDRSTCILFGDGAGALILSLNPSSSNASEQSPEGSSPADRGIITGKLFSDGSLGPNLCLPANPNQEGLGPYISMAGREVFKSAVRSLSESSQEVLKMAGLSIGQIDHYASHQANSRILQAVAKQLDLDEKKLLMNVASYGNTSAASLPLLLCEAHQNGHISQGDTLMLSAYGGGATWGALVMRF